MEPPPAPTPTVLAALERFSIEVEDEVVVAPATGVKWEKRRTCEPPLSGLAYLGIPWRKRRKINFFYSRVRISSLNFQCQKPFTHSKLVALRRKKRWKIQI